MNVSTRTSNTAIHTNCQTKSSLPARSAQLLRWLFLLLAIATFSVSVQAQTTLISSTGDGGFETGTTPALNNWTAVNSATDAWVVGNTAGVSAGSRAAFISSNSGTSYAYSQVSAVQHLYYDVAVPAGQTIMTLTFKWKAGGEGSGTSDWDNMKVYASSVANIGTPAANVALLSTYQISGPGAVSGMYKLNSAAYNSETISFLGVAGTTMRLVFSWKSDITDIVNPPAAIDEVNLVSNTPGSYTASALGGLWSSAATWGGTVPPAGSDVTIPAGSIVTVDQALTLRNVTINGTLQWGASSFAMVASGDVLVGGSGKFLAYTTGATGQSVTIGGNYTNDGFANHACASATLSFNGSILGGSLSQTFGGTGTFVGDGTRALIRTLGIQSNGGSLTINTSQNLTVVSGYIQTAGTVVTNNKLKFDNTAQVYGQALNLQVASAAVTNMGSLYTTSPVVFGAAVTQWSASGTAVSGTRYASGGNVYLCTSPGVFDAVNPPTGTTPASTFTNGTATLLYMGPLGQLGTPFLVGALTAGTQYFYNGNLYTCTVAGTSTAVTAPVHLSGTASSGTATLLYAGTAATATVNYDATTQTVRSINITNPGSGYVSAPAIAFSVGNFGGTGSAASATAVFIQQIAGTASFLTQRTTGTTVTGLIDINSDQGASVASADPQASSGVGNISTSNGGLNYTVAPVVGFTLPTGINLITDPGSGYTSAPTITVTGGNLVSGTALTSANFTITVNSGRVESVYLTGGTGVYSTLPSLALTASPGTTATLAFPAGCLPAATANIGANRQLTSFTMTNAGFGYTAAPTVAIGTTSGSANGGTFTTVATAPTARIALYNYTLNFFAPASSASVQADDAVIPVSRKMNALTLAGNGNGLALTSGLTLFATSSALALTASLNTPGNILDLGGNTLQFTGSTYAGTTSTYNSAGANTYIKNGSMTLFGRGGGSTFNFPFAGATTSGAFTWFAGSGTAPGAGSTITKVTVTETAAPSGAGAIGNRAYRVQTATTGGSYSTTNTYGTNPTVTMQYNSPVDNLPSGGNAVDLYISQSAALSGAWTPRSVSSGSGTVGTSGNRVTATVAPGPIAQTGDDYYAWTSVVVGFTNVSTPTNACTPTSHVINADVTSSLGTITGVTITYNNGAAVGPVAMTNSGGNTWTYTIPAASPGNTIVTWSITATNSVGVVKTYTGTTYQDDPLNGAVATIVSATPNPVCLGSNVTLTGSVTKPGATVSIGTGTSLTTATTQPTAFCNRWPSYRMQLLFTAAELQAAGLTAGNITAMTFNISTLGDAATNAGFSVRIGNTLLTALTAFEDSTVMTQVFNPGTYTHAVGLNTMTFGTPFNWNGTSNIIVQVVHLGANATNNSQTYYTATGGNTVAYTSTAWTNSASLSANRLNVTFTGVGAAPISTYTWNDGTNDVGTGNPFQIAPTGTTTYTFTGTDASGCTIASAGVTVNTTALPTTPTGGNSSQCGTGVPTAFVVSQGTGAGYFRWYLNPTGGTAVQSGTGTTYTGSINTTTTFYVSDAAFVDGSGCESQRFAVIATVNPPDAVSATSNGPVCSNSPLTLTATNIAGSPSQNYTYSWSANTPTGSGIPTPPIAGGSGLTANTIITPTAPGSYTYTVSAVDGSCSTTAQVVVTIKALPIVNGSASATSVCQNTSVTLTGSTTTSTQTTVQIGSGIATNSASTTVAAFYATWYGNGRAQMLVKASELTALGFIAGNLNNLKIDVSQLASAPDNVVKGFTINLAQVPVTTTAITTFQAPTFTTVYGPTDYTPVIGTNTHNFIAPFAWDGVSNIIIETCFANGITGGGSAVNTNTTTAFGSYINYQVDGVVAPCAVTTVSNASTSRPNIKFTGEVGTIGPGTLVWTWNPGSLSGPVQTVSPNVVGVNSYYVDGYDAVSGCTGKDTVDITVNQVPAQPTATPNSDICGTGTPTITLTSNSGAGTPVFQWYSADAPGGTLLQSSTSNTYTTNISTTTTFWVTELLGSCESDPRVSVTQTVNSPDSVSAWANGVDTSLSICLGTSVVLSADQVGGFGNTYDFTWSATGGANSGMTGNPQGNPLSAITPLAAGTYTYTVNAFDNSSQCAASSYVQVVVHALPVVDSVKANPTTICAGEPVSLTGYSGVISSGPQSLPGTYCVPTSSGSATLTNISFNTLNVTGFSQVSPYYDIFPATGSNTTTLVAGNTYTMTLGTDIPSGTSIISVWIDYNRNGSFDNTEWVQPWTAATSGSINITIPANATPGQTGMRIRTRFSGNSNSAFDACTSFGSGGAADFTVNILGIVTQNPSLTYNWNDGVSNVASGANATVNPTVNTTYTLTVTDVNGCSSAPSSGLAITVNPLPPAPTATNSTQCGAGVPTASVTTGGGGAGFKWYSAQTGGTLLQVGGSTYATSISSTQTFWVSESNGTCESPRVQVTATVTAPPTLTITPSGATTFCEGLSVSLDGATGSDPGYTTFNWSPTTGLTPTSGAVVVAAPLTTTTYTLTASGGGCTNSTSITVTINPKPVITTAQATPATICLGGSSALTATSLAAAAGTATVGNGATTMQGGSPFRAGGGAEAKTQILYTAAELNAAGIYAGNITSLSFNFTTGSGGTLPGFEIRMGHTAATNLSATFEAAPATIVYPAASLNPPTGTGAFNIPLGTAFNWDGTSNLIIQVCHGNPSPTGGSGFVAASVTGSAMTSQTVVTGACSATAATTFTTRPDITFGAVVGTDVTGNYQWTWNPGAISGSTAIVSPASNQTYTVTAVNPVTLCSQTSGNVTVTVAPVAGAPAAAPAAICIGQSSTLTANATGGGPFTYVWLDDATPTPNQVGTSASIVVSPTVTTTYTVVVTDACSNSTAALPVTVTVNALPTVSILETGPITICQPATQVLTASTAAVSPTYQWTLNTGNINLATNPTYTVSAVGTGTYSVKVTDGNGCVSLPAASVVVTINAQPSTVTVSPATHTLCAGDNVTLTASGGTIGATVALGTDATTTSTAGITPFNSNWEGSRVQYLIRASELTGLGLSAGNINSIAFDVTAAGPGTFAQSGFTIKMGHSNLSAMSTTAFETPTGSFTTVYGPVSQGAPTTGLYTFTFSTPFVWDGTSSILIDICHDNDISASCASCYSSSSTVKYTATGFNSTYGRYDDNIQSCGSSATLAASTFVNRPNMVINGAVPTSFSWAPATGLNVTTGPTVIASPLSTVTYTATATSGAGCSNAGTSDITVNQCPSTLNLTAFLEGFYYDINTMRANIYDLGISTDPTETDTLLVGLWAPANLTNPSPDYTMQTVVHTDGTCSPMVFPAGLGGNSYYIQVKHRNHIETWSAAAVAFKPTVNYNFTTSQAQAFDDGFDANPPMAPVAGGKFAFYGGDVNQDGGVDGFDASALEIDVNAFAFGYNASDANGDGSSDGFDASVIEINANLFIFFSHP